LPALELERAEGGWLHGRDGKRYFDASSGAVCVNVGHAHPHVVRAIARQAERAAFAHPGARAPHELEALAERLLVTVASADHGIVFSTTGTTAVETAIALARQYQRLAGYPERVDILTSDISYHGCSAFTLALSGHRRRRPRPEEAFHLAPAFHAPYGLSAARDHVCSASCVGEVTDLLDMSERVAAVLVEPVNGTTGGAFVPPPGYLARLAAECRERGVLVIHDEILTGLGRCGLPLAADAFDAAADLVVLAKGVGAGYAAISAVVVAPDVIATIEKSGEPLPMSGTMAGTPLAAATALAVQEALDETGVLDDGTERGARLGSSLHAALQELDVVEEVRGIGFFYGVALAPGTLLDALATARDHALVLYSFNGCLPGGGGEGVVVAPPLTSSDEELDWLVGQLASALDAVGRASET
jgi:taurine--2-oxoglutarate transaminase